MTPQPSSAVPVNTPSSKLPQGVPVATPITATPAMVAASAPSAVATSLPPVATAVPAMANGVPAVATPTSAASRAVPVKAAPANPLGLVTREDEEDSGVDWNTLIPSALSSMVVHIVFVLVLALWVTPVSVEQKTIITAKSEEIQEIEEIADEPLPEIEEKTAEFDIEAEEVVTDPSPVESTDLSELPSISEEVSPDIAGNTSDFLNPTGDQTAILSNNKASGAGSAYAGRTAGGRKGMAKKGGGNDQSEDAVEKGLKWIASVQGADGGWNFDFAKVNKPGVTNSGDADRARNGATAMALLPFLAAGYTHKEASKYQKTVYAGLEFLKANYNKKYTNLATGVISWHEEQGTMYSHGLVAMTLCEAYGMTKDKSLLPFAQGSLNFISYAQDPAKGGWRYAPREAGDTSVVGWQLMALKSGLMSYLKVDPNTIKQAIVFLNSVSDEKDYRAYYGYTGPGKGNATTAIGLLCRMHLGWKADNQGLAEGVQYLSDLGPSKTNMYFNYYATQVLYQLGENPVYKEKWDKWNAAMRDKLIKEQATDGANAGSWFFGGGDHSTDRGGRLYTTSLACLTLEVYYRTARFMNREAVNEGFPL